jgi:hypothetical protein
MSRVMSLLLGYQDYQSEAGFSLRQVLELAEKQLRRSLD